MSDRADGELTLEGQIKQLSIALEAKDAEIARLTEQIAYEAFLESKIERLREALQTTDFVLKLWLLFAESPESATPPIEATKAARKALE